MCNKAWKEGHGGPWWMSHTPKGVMKVKTSNSNYCWLSVWFCLSVFSHGESQSVLLGWRPWPQCQATTETKSTFSVAVKSLYIRFAQFTWLACFKLSDCRKGNITMRTHIRASDFFVFVISTFLDPFPLPWGLKQAITRCSFVLAWRLSQCNLACTGKVTIWNSKRTPEYRLMLVYIETIFPHSIKMGRPIGNNFHFFLYSNKREQIPEMASHPLASISRPAFNVMWQ